MKGKNKGLRQGFAFVAVAFTISPLIAFAGAAIQAASTADGGTFSVKNFLLPLFSSSTMSALRFSLVQASLSALLALVVGFPGAFFVAKYNFLGRRFFLALSAIPFCLPPILVILSFILYYGKSGWFTLSLSRLGMHWEGGSFLYTLWGLVFVHAFYNFPIIVQNVGSVWSKLPRSREEAARTLGAGRFTAFATGTLPHLLPSIIQSVSLGFLFCFFSFTIVLVFGGMAGTTLEVGIYRAIRFTNDKPKALVLAFVQTLVALIVVGSFAYFDNKSRAIAKGFGSSPSRKNPGQWSGCAIVVYQILIVVFFLGPLFALAAEAFTVRSSLAGETRFGLDNFTRLMLGENPLLPWAAVNSIALSGSAALLATLLGLAIAASSHYGNNIEPGKSPRTSGTSWRSWITVLPLALSPAVITAGWSALLDTGSEILIIIGQTAIAWPFVARSLDAAFSAIDRSKHEVARTLGSSPLRAFVLVDAAIISPSVASAAAFSFSITMGDVNIPLVLGGGKYETLPLLLYRLTSSYRFNEACAVGIVLALFTSVAFFLKERTNEVS
jgi:thiamine transport system permease protein